MQEPTLGSGHSGGGAFQRGIHSICHMYEMPPVDDYYLFPTKPGLQLNHKTPHSHCSNTQTTAYDSKGPNNDALPSVGFRKSGELVHIFLEVLV
jgi:hypothetical protein